MPIETETIVFTAPRQVEVRRVQLPDLGPHDVGVRTVYSGVSLGTERHNLIGTYNLGGKGRMAERVQEVYPFFTGYQKSGVVDRVGSEVTQLKPGDRVILSHTRLLDEELERRSWLGHSGYSVMPEDQVWPLPESADLEEASLFVMAGVGLHGNRLANVQSGDVVAIFGQGMIGQMSAQAARLRGAKVIACDVIEKRVEASRRYSADIALNASTGDFPAAVRREAPDGADVVTDTTGMARMFSSCLDLVCHEGKIILQGYYPDPIVIDFHPTHAKRVAVFFPCSTDHPASIAEILGQGKLAIKPLITHRLPHCQAPEAYRLVLEKPEEVISMVFRWE